MLTVAACEDDWRESVRICSTEGLCDRVKYWMVDLFSENKSEVAG